MYELGESLRYFTYDISFLSTEYMHVSRTVWPFPVMRTITSYYLCYPYLCILMPHAQLKG